MPVTFLETTPNSDILVQCRDSLGMHSGAIPDSAITASSSFEDSSVGPKYARITDLFVTNKDNNFVFFNIYEVY
ncbi:DNA damage responsive protein [Mactra antiquata]